MMEKAGHSVEIATILRQQYIVQVLGPNNEIIAHWLADSKTHAVQLKEMAEGRIERGLDK